MVAGLLSLLVPPCCAVCHAALPRAGEVLCGACRRALPWLGGGCPRCALPAHRARGGCPAAAQAFGAAWAAVAYEGAARDVVAALKFAGRRPLAGAMAAHLAAGLPAALLDGAAIVPVPADPARRRARGFDAARMLAAELARRTGRPLLPAALRRCGGARQLGASRAQRLAVGRVAVRAPAGAPPRVLLVDDVHTTGATLDACARALRGAGAREVAAATWARTLDRPARVPR